MIRSEQDLLELLQRESILHPFRKPQALILVPQMDHSEAAAWENRLEHLRQQCGCTAGAIGLAVFAIASVAYILRTSSLSNSDFNADNLVLPSAIFLGGLIMSAALGKLLALSVAIIRYRRTCFELKRRLTGDPALILDLATPTTLGVPHP